MIEDLCRILLKVFHRALGLPLLSAITVEWCLCLDCLSKKIEMINNS